MNITTKQGTVIEYSSAIAKGKIKTNDEEIYQFHSTSFQSSLPTRFPYLYEDVIVTFDNDRLISVRSDIEKQKSKIEYAKASLNSEKLKDAIKLEVQKTILNLETKD